MPLAKPKSHAEPIATQTDACEMLPSFNLQDQQKPSRISKRTTSVNTESADVNSLSSPKIAAIATQSVTTSKVHTEPIATTQRGSFQLPDQKGNNEPPNKTTIANQDAEASASEILSPSSRKIASPKLYANPIATQTDALETIISLVPRHASKSGEIEKQKAEVFNVETKKKEVVVTMPTAPANTTSVAITNKRAAQPIATQTEEINMNTSSLSESTVNRQVGTIATQTSTVEDAPIPGSQEQMKSFESPKPKSVTSVPTKTNAEQKMVASSVTSLPVASLKVSEPIATQTDPLEVIASGNLVETNSTSVTGPQASNHTLLTDIQGPLSFLATKISTKPAELSSKHQAVPIATQTDCCDGDVSSTQSKQNIKEGKVGVGVDTVAVNSEEVLHPSTPKKQAVTIDTQTDPQDTSLIRDNIALTNDVISSAAASLSSATESKKAAVPIATQTDPDISPYTIQLNVAAAKEQATPVVTHAADGRIAAKITSTPLVVPKARAVPIATQTSVEERSSTSTSYSEQTKCTPDISISTRLAMPSSPKTQSMPNSLYSLSYSAENPKLEESSRNTKTKSLERLDQSSVEHTNRVSTIVVHEYGEILRFHPIEEPLPMTSPAGHWPRSRNPSEEGYQMDPLVAKLLSESRERWKKERIRVRQSEDQQYVYNQETSAWEVKTTFSDDDEYERNVYRTNQPVQTNNPDIPGSVTSSAAHWLKDPKESVVDRDDDLTPASVPGYIKRYGNEFDASKYIRTVQRTSVEVEGRLVSLEDSSNEESLLRGGGGGGGGDSVSATLTTGTVSEVVLL